MAPRPAKEWLRVFFYGMCMGAADIVPGVSGGTMALICGIYEKLIQSVKSIGTTDALSIIWLDFQRFNKKVAWDFLLAVLLGIAFSLIIFSQAIHLLLGQPDSHTYLYALFFGMILSSIVVCIWRVPNWESRLWAGLAAGAFTTLLFSSFRSEPLLDKQFYEVVLPSDLQYRGNKELLNYDPARGVLQSIDADTLAAMWARGVIGSDAQVFLQGSDQQYRVADLVAKGEERWFNPWLFVCGAIAVSAMLLPGISGSFLLMILGAYPIVINALAELVKGWIAFEWDADAFFVLANIALGICTGAILFSKVVDRCLKRDHDMTMAVLIGFMAGSLRAVWPYRSYFWRLDPLKLLNGPQLVPGDPYIPSIGNAALWKAIPFLAIGIGLVSLLYKISENAKKR